MTEQDQLIQKLEAVGASTEEMKSIAKDLKTPVCPYGWIIDIDHIPSEGAAEGTNSNAKGMMGPRGINDDVAALLKLGSGREFRMYDDDAELYYTGRIIVRGDPCSTGDMKSDAFGEEYFAPLDDFGMPNAGAVRIDYQNAGSGKWETL
jgi:hypothetical protein